MLIATHLGTLGHQELMADDLLNHILGRLEDCVHENEILAKENSIFKIAEETQIALRERAQDQRDALAADNAELRKQLSSMRGL